MHASTWTSTCGRRRHYRARGLDRADLVVGELHRDEQSWTGPRRAPRSGRTDRARRHRPRSLRLRCGDMHRARRVLDRRRHDVRGRIRRATAPHMAVFTASVPLAVKTTSRGRAPRRRDLLARASSSGASPAPRRGAVRGRRGDRAGTAASPRMPRGAAATWTRGRDTRRTSAASNARDAVIVARGTALGEQRVRVAVEAGEHPADHARSTEHTTWGVLLGRVAERALLGDDLQ